MPADAVFILIGAQPHTGWLPDQVARGRYGFVVTGAPSNGWPLARTPFVFESSMPGVFAVCDVPSDFVKRARVLDVEGHDLPGVRQAHVDPVTRVVDTLRR